MQIAQDFKCPYELLSCKGNEEGECKCKDGYILIISSIF